jgi:hypothetical protein
MTGVAISAIRIIILDVVNSVSSYSREIIIQIMGNFLGVVN